jgi:hypothetical protein
MPTIDDIIHQLNQSTVFSALDCNQAFLQLELAPESRNICTFASHIGMYRFKRLTFGLNCASEIFQSVMQQVLADIPGVCIVCDDLLVHGPTQRDHDKSLQAVVKRLAECGFTLNKAKCKLNQTTVEFYGHEFSAGGVRIAQKRIDEIKRMKPPTNVAEVRSLLGMLQYNSRFLERYAILSEPLRRLTKQGTPFKWGETEQKAYKAIIDKLCMGIKTVYFDPRKKTAIVVDASPIGVAAALAQPDERGEMQIICYASKALTDVQTRYSVIEKEAYACLYGVTKFRRFVYGSDFVIVTDHRPLLKIFGDPKAKLPARLERFSLQLQAYRYEMQYVAGKYNASDYLSRHPTDQAEAESTNQAELYVNFLVENTIPRSMTLPEVKDATRSDPVLTAVVEMIATGNWRKADSPELKRFYLIRDELCLNADKDIVLRQNRLVLPVSLQQRAVELAHVTHQGMSRTKALLRTKVWFPRMDNLVDEIVKGCIPCACNTLETKMTPLEMTSLPRSPYDELSIDFCGVLPDGSYLLVIVCEYSRYPIVEIVRSTAAETVIPVVDKILSMFGIPRQIKSDNGPCFNGSEWAKYAEHMGFKHRKICPLWPQSNSQVERFNKTMMKAIRAAIAEGKDWKVQLQMFLRMYRNTPHGTTEKTPAELLFGRRLRTQLPQYDDDMETDLNGNDDELRQTDSQKKQRMKDYADKVNHSRPHNLSLGDVVLVKQNPTNKFSTKYNKLPYRITGLKGTMVTANRDNHSITRHCSFFKKMPQNCLDKTEEEVEDDIIQPQPNKTKQPANGNNTAGASQTISAETLVNRTD